MRSPRPMQPMFEILHSLEKNIDSALWALGRMIFKFEYLGEFEVKL